MKQLFLPLAFCVLAACCSNAQAQTATVRVVEHGGVVGIVYRGDISQDGVNQVISALSSHPQARVLDLSSQGGVGVAARALADLIEERNLILHLEGVCLSACATFVLPAATTVSTGPNYLAGTFKSDIVYAQIPGIPRSTTERQSTQHSIAEEERFFSRHNIKVDHLYSLTGPEYFSCWPPVSGPSGSQIRMRARYLVVVPSAATLQRAGYRVPQNWPSSTQEVQRRAAALGLPNGAAGFVDRPGILTPQTVPQCPPNQRRQ